MQHIERNSDLERRLFELAKRTGRTASELIEEGIEDLEDRYREGTQRGKPPLPSQEAREELGRRRAAEWLASIKELPHTPPLSDEAISRESMYGARG